MKFRPLEVTVDPAPLSGTLPGSILDLHEDLIRADSEIKIDLTLQRDEESKETIFVLGRLSTTLHLLCGRCLEWMEWPIEVNDFCVTFEPPLATSIDLTGNIREDIILRLPLRAACQLDAQHRCPLTGKMYPPPKEAPESILGADAWQSLNKLKIKE